MAGSGVGLPWGSKARLVLYHLNAETIQKQSRVIEVKDSLTAFVGRTLGLNTNGRNLRAISMCRKRPFAIHRRGRRPARAAVCRIPCLILCLADIERVGQRAGST